MSEVRLVNGRASDSQFAQNPLPIANAMGLSLGRLHREPVTGLVSKTQAEVDSAIAVLDDLGAGERPPAPFGQVRPHILRTMLETPPVDRPLVRTHGSPIVAAAVVIDSVVIFESAETEGLDPPERDLAIVFRSIAETFTAEVCTAFLDGYLEEGGALPHALTLDWYALVAAFR